MKFALALHYENVIESKNCDIIVKLEFVKNFWDWFEEKLRKVAEYIILGQLETKRNSNWNYTLI